MIYLRTTGGALAGKDLENVSLSVKRNDIVVAISKNMDLQYYCMLIPVHLRCDDRKLHVVE